MKVSLSILCTVICLAVASVAAQEPPASRIKEQELADVRDKISQLKQTMDARVAERDQVTGDLQAAEARIAEQRRQLRELARQKEASERRKLELENRLLELQALLDKEAELLAAQVRAAYVNGSQERLRLLLNQQDPAELGRQLVYYRYLSTFRGANIERMTGHLEEATRLRDGVASEEQRLEGLARSRYAELALLNEAQEERRELLTSLEKQLDVEGAEMQRLAAQEKDLARLIAELTSILSDYPITAEDPFSNFKGRLTWPVAGSLLHEFGQPRGSGSMKWNGVVLAAPRGREVRTIYHGRVVFADWLAGMGLLVIVDHGEGYMTLYGYNESILANAGDWVAPGDAIATVGDSGGQQSASLYFEIRKGTNPVNPSSWVTRQPQGKR
ncbi:MAG: peptidoglycan DD-metalloendopeptidase family protein [Woeseia sp.]|nr:peptidoglycan DD-metalloendopeptidase family protein [Woeseia sp.]NNL55767.1 peptidoglycan DD-metalloendopeptidase family protein [Woeseia sp.]